MSKIGIQTHGVNQSIMRKGLRGGGIAKRGTGVALRGGGIAKRGKGIALKTGGRAALWHGGPHNTGRTNLLEELGRVEGERSDPNRRAEISRVHGELNRGYKDGGRTGFRMGRGVPREEIKKKFEEFRKKSKPKISAGALKGRDPGREPRGTTRKWIRATPTMAAEGGRIGLKAGTDPKFGGAAKKRKIEQTKAVKRLMTSGEAYSPEKRIIRASKKHYNGSRHTGTVMTQRNVTDWHNIKKEKEKLKGKFGPRTRVNVYTPETDPHKLGERRDKGGKRVAAALAPQGKPKIMRPTQATTKRAEGGRIGLKEGTDKRWMQKVSASIKKRGTKGKCTPITKPGCTGRAKALAKTFNKMADKRKA